MPSHLPSCHRIFPAALLLAPLLLAPRLGAEIVQWDLENNLEPTRGTNPLEERAAPNASIDFFFETVKIGDKDAGTLHFQKGTYFHMAPGLPPNGGGRYVNQYTLIMDVMFPDRGGGRTALFNTNSADQNDGDWFINTDGGLGILTSYGGNVTDGDWHRLACVVDLVVGTMTSYIDGAQVQQISVPDIEGIDGRWALYSVNDGGQDGILLFADEDGEDSEGLLNSVQFRDTALSSDDIAALGGPTAEGIPIPSDPRDCGLRNFTVSYDASTKSVKGTWVLLPGDEGFRVRQGQRVIGDDLADSVTTFEDTAPPSGGTGVVYTLMPLVGGNIERNCNAPPIETFGCPGGFTACTDQTAGTVALSWTPPTNVNVTRYHLKRDGAEISTPAAADTTAVDSSPGPGFHTYELTAQVGVRTVCPLTLHTVLTGVPIAPAGECGGVVAQYEFDNDLKSATHGQDLVPAVSPPLAAGDPPGVTFETFDLDGESGTAARYSRGTYFHLFTGFTPNGGGAYTNVYTLILDVKFDAGALDASGYAPFYNTNTADANDGDWFLRASDRGIGIAGVYGGLLPDDEWHRIALVVDLVAGTYTSYIDGAQVMEIGGQDLDGRFALYSVNDGAQEGILLFADESGDNAEGLVGSAQMRDRALSADELAAFGGASAKGIPFQPPCAHGLSCTVDQGARQATLTWVKGSSAAVTGVTVRRDGATVGTLPADAVTFSESGLAPGVHLYEVTIDGHDLPCSNLPLTCEAEVLGDRLFFDDFEAYATDADLTAAGWQVLTAADPVEASGWTLTNPGHRAHPPTGSGLPANGKFVISDSAAGPNPATPNTPGSGMSYDLITPAFSTAGAGPVVLHADLSAQLQNDADATAVLDIDVSTDGGGTWSNVLERVSPGRTLAPAPEINKNADGFFGRLDLDLSAVASDKPSVRLRFRHFEPTRDLWVALDDVLVDRRPPGGSVTALATVDFAGGIPTGWTVVSGPLGDGSTPWGTQDTCTLRATAFPDSSDGQGLHYLDSPFALIHPACSLAVADEYLVTPSLDLSALGEVFLHVKSATLPTRDGVAEVLLSLDGGSTFLPRPIFSYSAGGLIAYGEDPVYGDLTIDASRAAGQARAAFAFHYRSLGGTGRPATWWAIDDVEVTGNPGTAVGPKFHRGDADDSGKVDITDPVLILGYLFQGAAEPACLEAADADDSGKVDITDAVRILAYLFQGGVSLAPPGPPPADCGLDPAGSPGFLGCKTHTTCP